MLCGVAGLAGVPRLVDGHALRQGDLRLVTAQHRRHAASTVNDVLHASQREHDPIGGNERS